MAPRGSITGIKGLITERDRPIAVIDYFVLGVANAAEGASRDIIFSDTDHNLVSPHYRGQLIL